MYHLLKTTSEPISLHTSVDSREWDRLAIASGKVEGFALMQEAGRQAGELIKDLYLQPYKQVAENLLVFCGTGNNGGDGFILAEELNKFLKVQVLVAGAKEKISGDARLAYEKAQKAGIDIRFLKQGDSFEEDKSFLNDAVSQADLIVDALLGTGISGALREDIAYLVDLCNQYKEEVNAKVLAIDIPTGLNADTGTVDDVAIRADVTISFVSIKQGMLTGQSADYVGELYFDDLRAPEFCSGVDTAELPSVKGFALNYVCLRENLSKRERVSHKRNYGHVLAIGGNKGMGGAIALASSAALRTGAGLISVACHPDNVAAVLSYRPELMVRGVSEADDLQQMIAKATCIILGPGLGQDEWANKIFSAAVKNELPKVIDADALNLLSEMQQIPNLKGCVLTPHPGEAARLLDLPNAEINDNRFHSTEALFAKYQCALMLKGAGSLMCSRADNIDLCLDGNPGMASGGMGDVLSGIIAALLAQGYDTELALNLGVCLHSRAADLAAADLGERGLIASDLISQLPKLVNPVL